MAQTYDFPFVRTETGMMFKILNKVGQGCYGHVYDAVFYDRVLNQAVKDYKVVIKFIDLSHHSYTIKDFE